MVASAFKLIPLPALQALEEAALRRLDSLPATYRKDLLQAPEHRYAYLYYLLFTHWPRLLNGETTQLTAKDVFYNRYYWFRRLTREYEASHGYDAGFEQQAFQILEQPECAIDLEIIRELEDKVTAELATNEK